MGAYLHKLQYAEPLCQVMSFGPNKNSCPAAISHTVLSNPIGFKTCAVYLRDVCLPLLLDNGAKVSLLNLDTYKRFFSKLPLQHHSTALSGFGQERIEVLG